LRLALLLLPLAMLAQTASSAGVPAYPESRRDALVDTQFGEKVADPWRWLENDVRSDGEAAGWVARENAVTQTYLATLAS